MIQKKIKDGILMITNDIKYIKAYTEFNFLLEYLPQIYIDKLPKKLIELISKQADDQFNIKINPNKSILEQNLSKETKDLIAVLKYNYWSTDKEKEKLKHVFLENEKKYQEYLENQYNFNNLFKKKTVNEANLKEEINNKKENNFPIKFKQENLYRRIINLVKRIFHMFDK